MYSVITADDEPFVLDGLELMVDWAGHDFKIMDSATDGFGAYELIKRLKPQLAVLDIQMPGMNGIEIARKVAEDGIDCQIMILTAYADTDYAKECLRFGVKHFATKPIEPEMFDEALEDYKRMLDIKYGGRELISKSRGKRVGKGFEKKCVVAVKSDSFLGKLDMDGCRMLDHTDGFTTYLVGSDGDAAKDAEKAFKRICEKDENAIACYDFGANAEQCRKKAVDSLIRIIKPKPGTLYKSAEHGKKRISAADFGYYADKLNEGISFNDAEAVSRIIDEFFELLPECEQPLQYAKTFYVYIVMRLERRTVSAEGITDFMSLTGAKKVSDMHTIGEFRSTLRNVCAYTLNHFSSNENIVSDGIFDVIEKYICEHFREHIVIKDLAKDIYASPGYLGTVFTKKMGVSIKDYIHSLRLEEAVKLMNADDDRAISEIAFDVGYNNYNHFFTQFEKRFGMSPLEYKKLYKGKKGENQYGKIS